MMLELLVKATLVLGVAAVFGAASRGRVAASTRHAAWVAALVGAVLVPALGAWLPAIRVPLLPAELRALSAAAPAAIAAPGGQPGRGRRCRRVSDRAHEIVASRCSAARRRQCRRG